MCILCGCSPENEVRYTFYSCCSIIWGILFALFICFFVIPYSGLHNYKTHQCNITRIDYPTTAPTFDSFDDWKSCDCGKRCTSWNPCIRLYSDVDEAIMIKDLSAIVACGVESALYSYPTLSNTTPLIPASLSAAKSSWWILWTLTCGTTSVRSQRIRPRALTAGQFVDWPFIVFRE